MRTVTDLLAIMKNGVSVGVKLFVEAMDHAPAVLTWRECWVLAVLAEDANDTTRECWPGYDGDSDRSARFRARVRCSRSQYYATMRALIDKGVIESVRRGQKHAMAQFRILPLGRPPRAQGPGSQDTEANSQGPGLQDTDPSQGPGSQDTGGSAQGPGSEFSGSRFEAFRVPVHRTRIPQSPQIPSSLSLPLQLVRASRAVAEDEERDLTEWIIKTRNPATPAWWRAVVANGDLAVLAAAWRATRTPAPARPRGRCDFHLLPLPCIGCDADAKAADQDGAGS